MPSRARSPTPSSMAVSRQQANRSAFEVVAPKARKAYRKRSSVVRNYRPWGHIYTLFSFVAEVIRVAMVIVFKVALGFTS